MTKTKEQFTQDLQTIYNELQSRQQSLNSYYDILDEEKENPQAKELVDSFLKLLGISDTKESRLASLTRIVNLREDALEQILEKDNLTKEQIVSKKELAYGFVSMLHISRHEKLLAWIEEQKLLTPFYRSLMFGMHFVGIRLSEWQSYWNDHIINNINKELAQTYGDDAKVLSMLEERGLIDLAPNGEIGDRCYSVLIKDSQGEYKSVAYADAFPEHVQGVSRALKQLVVLLNEQNDELFHQKAEWIEYFSSIENAFTHISTDELIEKWADVDRAWMAIKTPLQVGHPLEYYEDHYRKAVALEWDLRIINPALQENSPTRQNIKDFASTLAEEFGADAKRIINKNLLQVDQTQLYIGQPILYYAAEFNGLFSAQVVPNDEQVSAELGKKIFAYADFVMESKKSKPIMLLSVETMGEDFVKFQRELINSNSSLWQKIYDISTIGHEYGHILWIDSDTETKMNVSGQFKNIEEFKATSGGLMAFFFNEKEELKNHIVDDLVSRAVSLVAWREVGEVLPYYCEGLIHLDILFDSGVITYNEQIQIDYSKYDNMKQKYKQAYKNLAKAYLDKVDAISYLDQYIIKEGNIYLPSNQNVKLFVEHYYNRYKEIGQQSM